MNINIAKALMEAIAENTANMSKHMDNMRIIQEGDDESKLQEFKNDAFVELCNVMDEFFDDLNKLEEWESELQTRFESIMTDYAKKPINPEMQNALRLDITTAFNDVVGPFAVQCKVVAFPGLTSIHIRSPKMTKTFQIFMEG